MQPSHDSGEASEVEDPIWTCQSSGVRTIYASASSNGVASIVAVSPEFQRATQFSFLEEATR